VASVGFDAYWLITPHFQSMAGPAQIHGVVFFAIRAVRITSAISDGSLRFHLRTSGLSIVQPKYDDIED
jgi:hypothetical protein